MAVLTLRGTRRDAVRSARSRRAHHRLDVINPSRPLEALDLARSPLDEWNGMAQGESNEPVAPVEEDGIAEREVMGQAKLAAEVIAGKQRVDEDCALSDRFLVLGRRQPA